MNAKKLFIIPLSAMMLAACSGTNNPGSSSGGEDSSGGVTSSSAPDVSTSTNTSGAVDTSTDTSAADTQQTGEVFEGIVRIYFHNDTATERSKRIYVWCDSVDGVEHNWTGYEDGLGAYYDVDIREAPYKGFVAGSISFIIKNPSTWNGQSADTLVRFSDYVPTTSGDGTPMIKVYSCFGEGNAIEVYPDSSDVLGDYIASFGAASNWNGLEVVGSGVIESYKLYCIDDAYMLMNEYEKIEHEGDLLIRSASPNQQTFTIPVTGGIDPQKTYRIEAKFASNPNKTKKKVATYDKLYDTQKFKTDYTYSGNDLGATYTPEATAFRVWAPTSTLVRLNIYMRGTPAAYTSDPVKYAFYDSPLQYAYLTKQAGGIFAGTVQGNLAGRYYTYTMYYNDGTYETIDPYAKACGINGLRGMIVDWDAVNPEGWDEFSLPAISGANNLSVYEVHVRDFTSHDTWVSNHDNAHGTYNAFAEEGTTYNGVTTGIDHLAELGVNAVQLLPAYDQDNDERTLTREENGVTTTIKPGYNWGYNPQNYNCVEGSYSSDPFDGKVRITEYKNMIATLAKKGIRTIMDVVYNHVASVTKSPLTITCPRYFFRYDANMNLIDDSGCGNCTNTDRPMMSKFVVDSCKFWAEQYNIKGFRFDLMGVLDTGTMRKVKDTLYDVDPSIVVYGEGWTGGSTSSSSPATTNNVYSQLGDKGKGAVGCFNDAGRDGSKGNTLYSNVVPADGWISEGSNVDNVYNTLTQIIGENRWAKDALRIDTMDPNQTVNYLACHDNYTLYDQINYLWNKNAAAQWANGANTYVMQACSDLQAICAFGQGIAFLHGGDEFFRQKVMHKSDDPKAFQDMVDSYKFGRYNKSNGEIEYQSTDWGNKDYDRYSYWIEGDGIQIDANTWLVRNSYKYGDAVNGFDWSRKATYNTYYQGFKNVFQLRKEQMGNALGQTKAQIAAGGTTCWSYNDLFNEDSSSKTDLIAGHYHGQKDGGTYYIFANKGNTDMSTIGIGNGSYKVLYSSNGTHTAGSTMNVTNNLMGAYKLECLIVKAM